MEIPQLENLSYTLRLTRTTAANEWRVTLYSAQSGVRWRFATIEQLVEFLHQACDVSAAARNERDVAEEEQFVDERFIDKRFIDEVEAPDLHTNE